MIMFYVPVPAAVSIPWDSSEHRHRKVNLEMSWKPPRKTEFGTRVQFEMTDVNSLKSQVGFILEQGWMIRT